MHRPAQTLGKGLGIATLVFCFWLYFSRNFPILKKHDLRRHSIDSPWQKGIPLLFSLEDEGGKAEVTNHIWFQ